MGDDDLPLFAIGIMADLQYADVEDGVSFVEKTTRRYRQSKDILREGVEMWKTAGTVTNILLGDQVDFKASHDNNEEEALSTILEIAQPRDKFNFLCGNHDLAVFKRCRIRDLYLPDGVRDASPTTGEILYYSTRPHPGFRFIFLDPFDVSSLNASSDDKRLQAEELLMQNNPNLVGEKKNGNWFTGIPLEQQRYVPYNGQISQKQLDWLASELASASSFGERVMIFSHLPVYRRCVHPSGLMWNAETVLELIQQSRNVLAMFSGHDHHGGYALDEAGIHHIIPPAPLECDLGQVAYGVLEVFERKANFKWVGKLPRGGSEQDPWPSVLEWRQ
jgi:manganese-dependent ADP-ribose/CDP-alcohol diphosphatase